jgi:DnaJ family protein C protein 7
LREKLKHAQLELKKSKRKDYYKVLGIEVGADEAAIKKGYRKMAILWHPDKHTQNGEEATKEAEIKFKEIGEGYAILSDPKKKQMYDEGMDLEEINQGGRSGGMGGGMDPNDVF